MGGLTLPGGLATLLNDIGYVWPNVDEVGLTGMGQSWMRYSADAKQPPQDAHGHATGVWSGNSGKAIDAFEQSWNHPQAPHKNLLDASTGSLGIGVGLTVCSAIVIALKINVIVQLVELAVEIASAIAEAAISFGASLLEIPVFKEITGMLVNLCINLSLNAIMGG